jgi:hypothetical protein
MRDHTLKYSLFVSFLYLLSSKSTDFETPQGLRVTNEQCDPGRNRTWTLPLAENPHKILKTCPQIHGAGKYLQHTAIGWFEYVNSFRGNNSLWHQYNL